MKVSEARPASEYRGARRKRCRALKMVWRDYQRRYPLQRRGKSVIR